MSLRSRIAGVAGVAVAVAVLIGAGLAYVAIRSELRGEVDTALGERAQPFAAFAPDSCGVAPVDAGAIGSGGPPDGPGGQGFDGRGGPQGLGVFGRRVT
ncbi:MAG: hypothetical protein QOI45_1733 [Thermoleophilaceae bacterium]|nr:hypothetical protein [Thermoleophilaceae bacterium]